MVAKPYLKIPRKDLFRKYEPILDIIPLQSEIQHQYFIWNRFVSFISDISKTIGKFNIILDLWNLSSNKIGIPKCIANYCFFPEILLHNDPYFFKIQNIKICHFI